MSVRTQYEGLQQMAAVPLLGGAVLFVLALLPVPVAWLLHGVFGWWDVAVLARVVALVAALWNLGLSLFARTTISLFAIPCWLLFFADRQFALLRGDWWVMWAVCMPKRPVNRLQAAWVYNTGMSMMWADGKYCAKCLHRYW